ncbi:hypothetical protein IJT10_07615 [bacterium]|nr:hypothetical protein [bacterium]
MDAVGGVSINGYDSSKMAKADKVLNEANKAIDKWDLKHLGWRGFEQLDWVSDITNKYPDAAHIAHTCSTTRPGYLDQVNDLFEGMPKEDRKMVHKYFIGKLALEELSCRMSGGAGGLCDKKGAYVQICQLTRGLSKD